MTRPAKARLSNRKRRPQSFEDFAEVEVERPRFCRRQMALGFIAALFHDVTAAEDGVKLRGTLVRELHNCQCRPGHLNREVRKVTQRRGGTLANPPLGSPRDARPDSYFNRARMTRWCRRTAIWTPHERQLAGGMR